MDDMCKIVHNDYDKISDFVYRLSKDWVLKMNVVLSYLNKRKERQNFHSEYGYYKKIENSIHHLVNIQRMFNYYLSFECSLKDSEGNKLMPIMITENDIYFLKYKLANVEKWILSGEVFAKKDNKIIIPNKSLYVERVDLVTKVFIEIQPSILTLDNEDQILGVRLYMNSDELSIFMTIDNFLSFYHLITNFNMFLSAQIMLAYFGIPYYGINYIDLANNKSSYNNNIIKHKFLNSENEN